MAWPSYRGDAKTSTPEHRGSRFARAGRAGAPERQRVNSGMIPGDIEKIFRDEAGRALATAIPLIGDFDLAEGGLPGAFAVAVGSWPQDAKPANPRGLLVYVGRNNVLRRVRRQS